MPLITRAVGLLVAAGTVSAQTPGRLATTPEALLASPVFFHGKQIAVRGTVVEERGLARLQVAATDVDQKIAERIVFVYWKDRPSAGAGEIRGDFWDLGRVTESDSRFSSYDFRPALEMVSAGQWPPRDLVFVILNAIRVESPPPVAPSVRAIAMEPTRYASRQVTVSGRFRGRNLYGDLPTALNKSRWDFVLQSADAALWVSGVRPRGRDFELDPGLRADTGRWLEVSGVVQTEGTRVWIEGKSIQLAAEPEEPQVEVAVPVTPREPPPEVIFSAPVPDEVDVAVTTAIRIQFSRALDAATLKGRVRVGYLAPAQGEPPQPPDISFTYNEGLNALLIKMAKPLQRFARVRVDLLEGITARDGQPLPPWSLTFSTGS
ncbi:MAG TPA: Ig-like domain-containing protein [Vicinamibacterales bacterium]|nr:Ig-like domain-containing protein [Vicinamibacterales bacterium]